MLRYGRPHKKRETIEDIIHEGWGDGFSGQLGLDYITAFSDASWRDGVAGWGGRIIHDKGPVRDSYYGNLYTRTSTDAELFAAQLMLDKIWETTDFQGKRVMIQCDCEGILRKLTFPEEVLAVVDRITIRHVRGHVNPKTGGRFATNDWCDRRATEMRLALEAGDRREMEHSHTVGNDHIPEDKRPKENQGEMIGKSYWDKYVKSTAN